MIIYACDICKYETTDREAVKELRIANVKSLCIEATYLICTGCLDKILKGGEK
jgi:hypothetical protein